VSTNARAQTADIIASYFRDVMADVATAGRLVRLDSNALGNAVRRAIRIYTGFGMGSPNRMVRLWEDERGVHGRFAVFWRTGLPRTALSPDEERARREELRERDARLRSWIDSVYGCRAPTQSRTINVCWLDERPDRVIWKDVLARLDSIGIESIRSPAEPKIGFDGWTIVVEVRSRAGYHSYSFWVPDPTSTDPGERAAASVATVVQDAFSRQIGK
jgi:hypothetical protein